jgi:hypothetical protein
VRLRLAGCVSKYFLSLCLFCSVTFAGSGIRVDDCCVYMFGVASVVSTWGVFCVCYDFW